MAMEAVGLIATLAVQRRAIHVSTVREASAGG
jgi:hypothetical protein